MLDARIDGFINSDLVLMERRTVMLDLNKEDGRETIIRQICHLVSDLNYSVFIYGAGVYGHVLAQYLRDNGVASEIRFVADDEYVLENSGIITLNSFVSLYSNKSVLILGIYDYPLISAFREKYDDLIPYMFEIHLVVVFGNYLKWEKEFFFENTELFNQTYDMLRDDESKLTMRLYLEAATGTGFDKLYQECLLEEAYYNAITCCLGIDTLIDCGAYDGDTVCSFISMYPEYRNIYAFEPDDENVTKLKNLAQRAIINNFHIIAKGVYSKTGILSFSSEGTSSSHICENGNTSVQVMKLDDLSESEYEAGKIALDNHRIMIKMDIEGCELEALKGAEGLIRRYNPCLAVCVYHKEEDMIRIPQFINSLVPDKTYDYYLRFHGRDLAELVFYAVPKSYRNVEEE